MREASNQSRVLRETVLSKKKKKKEKKEKQNKTKRCCFTGQEYH